MPGQRGQRRLLWQATIQETEWLHINVDRETQVKAAIEAQAGDRKRNVLVQAVSLLRQRKLDDVVKSLNNLLACNKVRLRRLTRSAAQHACAIKEAVLVVTTSLVGFNALFRIYFGVKLLRLFMICSLTVQLLILNVVGASAVLSIPDVQAMPSDKPAEWREKEELQDLYSVYVGRESDADKAASVAAMLGISDSEAASLKDLVASGQFKLEQEVEDDRFF